ncbi:hypothetical protein PR048_025999 [Dryococelus australis]|uniref:Uncharacterized protein n=1 Tax=Dryococelus australis TaxID=614101 RepID=A0ABQ9GK52_9NEOP|nr:hypothetical protein PR048_025999 [Dryococelus australis]
MFTRAEYAHVVFVYGYCGGNGCGAAAEYPRRWTGTGGPVPWPARSPDLSPLDFLLSGCPKSSVYSGRRSDTRGQLLQAITDATNQLRNELAGMQRQHAMVGYNVSQSVYGQVVHILNSSCETFNTNTLVDAVFDTSWRSLTQSSPSTVTADNQCAFDIGILIHKSAEFSLVTTETLHTSRVGAMRRLKRVLVSTVWLSRFSTLDAQLNPTSLYSRDGPNREHSQPTGLLHTESQWRRVANRRHRMIVMPVPCTHTGCTVQIGVISISKLASKAIENFDPRPETVRFPLAIVHRRLAELLSVFTLINEPDLLPPNFLGPRRQSGSRCRCATMRENAELSGYGMSDEASLAPGRWAVRESERREILLGGFVAISIVWSFGFVLHTQTYRSDVIRLRWEPRCEHLSDLERFSLLKIAVATERLILSEKFWFLDKTNLLPKGWLSYLNPFRSYMKRKSTILRIACDITISYLFPCKSAFGSDMCRVRLINYDPIAMSASVYTFTISRVASGKTARHFALRGDLALHTQPMHKVKMQCLEALASVDSSYFGEFNKIIAGCRRASRVVAKTGLLVEVRFVKRLSEFASSSKLTKPIGLYSRKPLTGFPVLKFSTTKREKKIDFELEKAIGERTNSVQIFRFKRTLNESVITLSMQKVIPCTNTENFFHPGPGSFGLWIAQLKRVCGPSHILTTRRSPLASMARGAGAKQLPHRLSTRSGAVRPCNATALTTAACGAGHKPRCSRKYLPPSARNPTGIIFPTSHKSRVLRMTAVVGTFADCLHRTSCTHTKPTRDTSLSSMAMRCCQHQTRQMSLGGSENNSRINQYLIASLVHANMSFFKNQPSLLGLKQSSAIAKLNDKLVNPDGRIKIPDEGLEFREELGFLWLRAWRRFSLYGGQPSQCNLTPFLASSLLTQAPDIAFVH